MLPVVGPAAGLLGRQPIVTTFTQCTDHGTGDVLFGEDAHGGGVSGSRVDFLGVKSLGKTLETLGTLEGTLGTGQLSSTQ